jgi:hypothetical protein
MIIVIQPANTGKDIIRRNDVKKIDQGNKGINNEEYKMLKLDDFNKVTIKLIDPNNELNPTICNEKNIKSIDE